MKKFPKTFEFKSLITGADVILTVKGLNEKKNAIIDVTVNGEKVAENVSARTCFSDYYPNYLFIGYWEGDRRKMIAFYDGNTYEGREMRRFFSWLNMPVGDWYL